MESVVHRGVTYVSAPSIVTLLTEANGCNVNVYAYRMRKTLPDECIKKGVEIGVVGHAAPSLYVKCVELIKPHIIKYFRDPLAWQKLINSIQPQVLPCALHTLCHL